MATIIPQLNSYVKVKKDIPNRDAILRRLRGAYGTSTKRAFKVLGYGTDGKVIQLKLEDVWGCPEWVDINYVEMM